MPAHFFGRSDLLETMVGHLTAEDRASPSLALAGQGGMGKTTLAIAATRHPQTWRRYRDGVLWARLGLQANAEAVLTQWGDSLGIEIGNLATLDQKRGAIQSEISDRQFLMVIDDVWDKDAALALKCGGPNTGYLFTTRHQAGARAFADRGLALSVRELEEEIAFNLLKEHAPRACETDPALARELVRKVGGLPLALEMLGKYLAEEGSPMTGVFQHLDVAAMEAMLAAPSRLALASARLGGRGTERTFQQLLELSLEAVSDAASHAFYTLGAFAPKPASFAQEAAAAVTGVGFKPLVELISASLVEVNEGQFAVHQSLSDLAREKMPAEAQNKHRTYYLVLVEKDETDWGVIEATYPQVQWGWAQNPEDETRMAWIWALHEHQKLRGLWGDYRDWMDWGLGHVRKIGDRKSEGMILDRLGVMMHRLGQNDQALETLEKALSIREEVGDRGGVAQTLNNLGLVYEVTGNPAKALEYYALALPIREEGGDRGGLAVTLNNIGEVYWGTGNLAKALEYYERARPIYEEVGDRSGLGETLNNIGAVFTSLGQRDKALEYYARALPIQEEVGDRSGLAVTLNNLGVGYWETGNLAKALEYYERALPIQEDVGDRGELGETLNNIGAVFTSLEQRDKALEYFARARAIREEVGDRSGLALTLNNIGSVYRGLGQNDKALNYYEQALPIMQVVGDRFGESVVRYNLAKALWIGEDKREALAQIKIAIENGKAAQSPRVEGYEAELAAWEAEME